MKRLRHPIRSLREPFGKAGLIVACLALIAALGGTAFAAAKLNSTQKKEVEKISKKFAGKPGAAGATGPAGPAGPTAPAGAAGKEGPQGKEGVPGKEGLQGKEGKAGKTGFTATLPAGETETGTWAAPSASTTLGILEWGSISFPIPLSAGLAPANVHYVTEAEQTGTPPSQCSGNAEEPEAAEGNLCVYEGPHSSPVGGAEEAHLKKPGANAGGASVAGALVEIEQATAGDYFNGSWAVTAG
jgi:hypothetical protein